MMILEANHEDYVADGAADGLSQAISDYTDLQISTGEFWGIAVDFAPALATLEAWPGCDAYGIAPQETLKFDGGVTGRLFESGAGYFFVYFAS